MAIYVQVFILLTFLENRRKIITREGKIKLASYPEVTVIVPSLNEEKTIHRTVSSLLGQNYPAGKLQIFLVDDGSSDGTLAIFKKFQKYPNIRVFSQQNGGKYTALNLGLRHTETPFVGCLDADSYADPEALIRIMSYFEKDPSAMAVSPSIVATSPKNIIQRAQRAEYYMAVFNKKMLALLGAIHVTPGPLTIFRKKVFDDLGPYKHAYNTEDMEIAYRMQKYRYKIEQCNDAYVYTNTPHTPKKLYKQRLRWLYGFINNTIDYRHLLFKKKYGHFSVFTVPSGILTILVASFAIGKIAYHFGSFIFRKITEWKTIGFNFSPEFNFDVFFLNTNITLFIMLLLYALIISAIVIGRTIAPGTRRSPIDIIFFFIVFGLVGPFWLMKAIYNTIRSKAPAWR